MKWCLERRGQCCPVGVEWVKGFRTTTTTKPPPFLRGEGIAQTLRAGALGWWQWAGV